MTYADSVLRQLNSLRRFGCYCEGTYDYTPPAVPLRWDKRLAKVADSLSLLRAPLRGMMHFPLPPAMTQNLLAQYGFKSKRWVKLSIQGPDHFSAALSRLKRRSWACHQWLDSTYTRVGLGHFRDTWTLLLAQPEALDTAGREHVAPPLYWQEQWPEFGTTAFKQTVVDKINALRTHGYWCGGEYHPPADSIEWMPCLDQAAMANDHGDAAQSAGCDYHSYFCHTQGVFNGFPQIAKDWFLPYCDDSYILDPDYHGIGMSWRSDKITICMADIDTTPAGTPYRPREYTGSPNDAQAFRQNVLSNLNQLRSEGCVCGDDTMPPVHPVQWDRQLQEAALKHSQYLAEIDSTGHQGRNNSSPRDRIEQTGYEAITYGENISYGPKSIAEMIKSLKKSPRHCAIMMSKRFLEVGVGRHEDKWTMDFAVAPENYDTRSKAFRERATKWINRVRQKPHFCEVDTYKAAPPLEWNPILYEALKREIQSYYTSKEAPVYVFDDALNEVGYTCSNVKDTELGHAGTFEFYKDYIKKKRCHTVFNQEATHFAFVQVGEWWGLVTAKIERDKD